MPFLIYVCFYFDEPGDFGIDLKRFPLTLRNNATNEMLIMKMREHNTFLIKRVPNDYDWQWLDDYIKTIVNLPRLSIGLIRFFTQLFY